MDGIERSERDRGMADVEDGVRALEEIGGDRHEAEASRGYIHGHLPHRSTTMRRRDRPLALLAQ